MTYSCIKKNYVYGVFFSHSYVRLCQCIHRTQIMKKDVEGGERVSVEASLFCAQVACDTMHTHVQRCYSCSHANEHVYLDYSDPQTLLDNAYTVMVYNLYESECEF